MKFAVIFVASVLSTGGDVERCFAWAHEQTDAPSLDETASEHSERLARAILACRASDGYVPVAAGAAVTSPPSVLVVGQPIAFRPMALPVSVVCDDLSVVRVEDAGTFLWLTGLKPGQTSCSFGSAQQAGRRSLYHFTVMPSSL